MCVCVCVGGGMGMRARGYVGGCAWGHAWVCMGACRGVSVGGGSILVYKCQCW